MATMLPGPKLSGSRYRGGFRPNSGSGSLGSWYVIRRPPVGVAQGKTRDVNDGSRTTCGASPSYLVIMSHAQLHEHHGERRHAGGDDGAERGELRQLAVVPQNEEHHRHHQVDAVRATSV